MSPQDAQHGAVGGSSPGSQRRLPAESAFEIETSFSGTALIQQLPLSSRYVTALHPAWPLHNSQHSSFVGATSPVKELPGMRAPDSHTPQSAVPSPLSRSVHEQTCERRAQTSMCTRWQVLIPQERHNKNEGTGRMAGWHFRISEAMHSDDVCVSHVAPML